MERIRDAVQSRARIVPVPPGCVLALARGLGLLLRDVVLTREELEGLRAGLLVSREPALGSTRLGDWLDGQAGQVGGSYLSELRLHYR